MVKFKNKALLYRWSIYFIALLLFSIGIFLRFSPAAIKTQLQDTFSLTSVGFSSLNSMYFYTYMIMQISVGIMVDTVGPKKMIYTGSIVMCLGCVIFGFSGKESKKTKNPNLSAVWISAKSTTANFFIY